MKDFELIINIGLKMSEVNKDTPLYAIGVSPVFKDICSRLPPLDLANTKKDIIDTVKEALDRIDSLTTDFQKALNEADGQ